VQFLNLLRTTTFRVAVVYLAVFAASVFLVLASIYWNTAGFMARQTDQVLDAEIRGLAEQYNQRGVRGLADIVKRRASEGGDSLYLIMAPGKRVVGGNLSGWPQVRTGADGWIDFTYDAIVDGEAERHAARGRHLILRNGLDLLVGRDVHERKQIEQRIVNALFWGIVITAITGLAGAFIMSRNMTARIDAVNKTSREIIGGDLSRRVPLKGTGDEMDELAGNLNAMLDKIERLMLGMREVADNIAHDLRSPLNRIRNRLEVTLMQADDLEAYREALEMTIVESDDLLSTFNALLSIARAEAGAARETMEPLELAELVSDTAELYEPVAEEKGLSFNCEIERAPMIWGNREMLAQAVTNLLDNAIKYSVSGGQIGISLKAGDVSGYSKGAVRLSVYDSGPGIPVTDRERVRQRFVRLERSRNTQGSGLGLSLVSAVAQLHEARLSLSDNDPMRKPPGLRAMLIFPIYEGTKVFDSRRVEEAAVQNTSKTVSNEPANDETVSIPNANPAE
jgi:signal transduction histidine kinase